MKPVTVVDITEPLQEGEDYVVTVEVPDGSQAAIAWPRFCSSCMRAAVTAVELSRTGSYELGEEKMMRRLVTRVPYCGECAPSPSKVEPGLYLKLLLGALVGVAAGLTLVLLGDAWRDLRLYGWFIVAVSSLAMSYGGFNFIRKRVKPEAVGLDLNPKGLTADFKFANTDYGRKFAEANPARGEIMVQRTDESIMFTGTSSPDAGADIASEELPDEPSSASFGGGVEAEGEEEDFKDRTSPSIQPFPAEEGEGEPPTSVPDYESPPAEEIQAQGEGIEPGEPEAVAVEDVLESAPLHNEEFGRGFEDAEEEVTIADAYAGQDLVTPVPSVPPDVPPPPDDVQPPANSPGPQRPSAPPINPPAGGASAFPPPPPSGDPPPPPGGDPPSSGNEPPPPPDDLPPPPPPPGYDENR